MTEGPETVQDRLRMVCAGIRPADLARVTGTHPESVRRYLAGDTPSLTFLAALCSGSALSADWLVCGRGRPISTLDARIPAERDADLVRVRTVLLKLVSRRPAGAPLASSGSTAG